jgi:erythromycin esterase-like protein
MAQVLRCFDPFDGDAQMYALATARHDISCAPVVARLVQRLTERKAAGDDDPDARLDAAQNAAVLTGAEAYYRAMVDRDTSSWNIRDRHMDDTLARLMAHHGPEARGLVWEHNTHIGDARYTDMALGGEVNVGQLARERYGDDAVVLIGFASHGGRVIAGAEWDAPMTAMPVPAARRDSWEDVLHKAGGDQLLIFGDRPHAPLPEELLEERGHRAIGVVYHPDREQYGNYVPTILPRRYDALMFFDRTAALHPLGLTAQRRGDTEDTYPSAF